AERGGPPPAAEDGRPPLRRSRAHAPRARRAGRPLTPPPMPAAPLRLGLDGTARTLQQLRLLLATPRGTVPLDRDFGVSWSFIDAPTPRALAAVRAEVADQVARYVPGVRVQAVELRATEPTGVRMAVTVDVGGTTEEVAAGAL